MSASARGPDTRSSTDVRISSRRTSSGCRSSTSASRYSATVRSLPENSARRTVCIFVPGQRQRRQPQPRRPALGPLMQYRHARARASTTPAAAQQLPRLGPWRTADRAARISASLPLQAATGAAPVAGHAEWPARTAAPAGRASPSNSSWASASAESNSCTSSITSQSLFVQRGPSPSSSRLHHRPTPSQARRRRQLPHQPRPRRPYRAARLAPTARTAADPAPRAPPEPTRHCSPAPAHRSRTAAAPSSRSRAAPTAP